MKALFEKQRTHREVVQPFKVSLYSNQFLPQLLPAR